MKFGRLFMTAAAIAMVGVAGNAQAANTERLTVHEINNFVEELTSSVNNTDPYVGRTFLRRNINANASFHNALDRNLWADSRYYGYHNAWSDYRYVSPYYRYPAYTYKNGYFQPTSHATMGRSEMINQLEHKKSMIPRYHQSIEILSSKMPADASSATLDIRLKEFGIYNASPYSPQFGHKVEHFDSRCSLSLSKEHDSIQITGMRCNTLQRAAL